MSRGSFQRALADADRMLAGRMMSVARERQIRAALARPRRRVVAPLVLAIGALATAAFAIAVVRDAPDTTPAPAPAVAPQVVAGFTVTARDGWRVTGTEVAVTGPQLELSLPGFGRIIAANGARLERIAAGVRVVIGEVEVDVDHRAPGEPPAVVAVSHGTIEVHGTRFRVAQRATGGEVTLFEGAIRFTSGDRSIDLTPGQTLAWPRAAPAPAPAPAPTPAPAPAPARAATAATAPAAGARGEPSPAVAADIDVQALLDDVVALRARGRYAEAAAQIERALAGTLPASARERLSYELGELLSTHLRRVDQACDHWRAHRRRYQSGRYTDEVDAALRRLDCEED